MTVKMDVKDLQNALKPWIRRAKGHINTDPELEALVRRCLNEDGDLRIATRAFALSLT